MESIKKRIQIKKESGGKDNVSLLESKKSEGNQQRNIRRKKPGGKPGGSGITELEKNML